MRRAVHHASSGRESTHMRAPHTGRYEFSQGGETTVWQGPGSFNLSAVVSRWSLPMGATDAELGSGISWALHSRMAKLSSAAPEAAHRRAWAACSPRSSQQPSSLSEAPLK